MGRTVSWTVTILTGSTAESWITRRARPHWTPAPYPVRGRLSVRCGEPFAEGSARYRPARTAGAARIVVVATYTSPPPWPSPIKGEGISCCPHPRSLSRRERDEKAFSRGRGKCPSPQPSPGGRGSQGSSEKLSSRGAEGDVAISCATGLLRHGVPRNDNVRLTRGSSVGGHGKQLVERHAHTGRAAQHVEQDQRARFAFVALEQAFEALEGAFQNPHFSSAPENGLLEVM